MSDINYGDPEPDRKRTIKDRHGDVWKWGNDKWESFETAPFAWDEMKRSWFPMKVIG